MDLLPPVDVSLVDSKHRSIYKETYTELATRIRALSKYNKRLLARLSRGRPLNENRAKLQKLYNDWQATMVVHGSLLNEAKRLNDGSRTTFNASIFGEISRLHFIIHFKQLQDEQERVLHEGRLPDVEERRDMLTLLALRDTRSQLWMDAPLPDSIDWETPIFKYSQSQVLAVVEWLCTVMHDVGSLSDDVYVLEHEDSALDFLQLFRVLLTRNAVFLIQRALPAETLDLEDMRRECKKNPGLFSVNSEYVLWCSCYFGAIIRRIYYWEALRENTIPPSPEFTISEEMVERCRQFIREVAEGFSTDAYEECYVDSCSESYTIPGDMEWFLYKFPTKQKGIGTILYEVRPEMNKRYQKEKHVSVSTVLTSSTLTLPRYFMRTSQLFVLNALDTYLRTYNIQWRDACVVANDGIELSHWKLTHPTCPVILQVFSRYWVYSRAEYIPTDDIYMAISLWFRILHLDYDDHLFSVSLTEVRETIFGK